MYFWDMNLVCEQELQRSLTYEKYILLSEKRIQQWQIEIIFAKTGEKQCYT